MRVRWSIAASNDTRDASDWYTEQSPAVAERFQSAFLAALAAVVEAPRRWPIWQPPGYRRLVLERFPYSLIYRIVDDDQSVLVALQHHSRDPSRRLS